MVAQRSPAPGAAERQARAKAVKPGTAESRPARQKLSFRDKHALDTLPARIAALEAEAAALRRTLADPGLFTRDPDAFSRAAASLAAKEEALAAAEEEWLALELLREELEA
jgi:ATP-binding cassette subfamily F protein uup